MDCNPKDVMNDDMKIRNDFLPVLKPCGGNEEVEALREVIESGWWTKGKKVEELERRFAKMVGTKYAVAVTSNTAGQDLVFKALEIKDCDVISPTISFATTASVPLWNGCTSTLADVDPVSMNISVEDVQRKVSSKTKAMIIVNHAGVPAQIKDIRKFFKGFILEDCAHSCYSNGAGLEGDVAVWSFQTVKTMPAGDGGMITLNDKDLYDKLCKMSWLGVSSTYSRNKSDKFTGKPGYSWDYDIDILGYKCYMNDLTAALALVQLEKLNGHLERRRYIQERYNKELSDCLQIPPFSETVQYYCAKVNGIGMESAEVVRNGLIKYLSDKKIHTGVHFKPLHLHSIFKQKYGSFPVAEKEWVRMITLPCFPFMTDSDIDYVIFWVKRYFETFWYNDTNP